MAGSGRGRGLVHLPGAERLKARSILAVTETSAVKLVLGVDRVNGEHGPRPSKISAYRQLGKVVAVAHAVIKPGNIAPVRGISQQGEAGKEQFPTNNFSGEPARKQAPQN